MKESRLTVLRRRSRERYDASAWCRLTWIGAVLAVHWSALLAFAACCRALPEWLQITGFLLWTFGLATVFAWWMVPPHEPYIPVAPPFGDSQHSHSEYADGFDDGKVQATRWRPMDTAPTNDTMVRLLVDYSGEDACHPLEDAQIAETIGTNTDGNTGLSEGWKFAGWSWEQDCFTQGSGKPIGWLPLASPETPK